VYAVVCDFKNIFSLLVLLIYVIDCLILLCDASSVNALKGCLDKLWLHLHQD